MGNEVSSAEDPHEPVTRAGTVPVGLRWPHGGKTAYVCGSFTQWQKVPMQWRQSNSGGEWFKVVDLAPGSYQYKFIVDGQWRHDHTAPTVLDNLGNVNNCVTIQASPASASSPAAAAAATSAATTAGGSGGAGGAGEARGSVSCRSSDPYSMGVRSGGGGSSSYGQIVPAREELLVHHSASLLLPPQLRLLLPAHHGDHTTMPLSVQMHHVFCAQGPEVAVLSMAHRYKDRSITQLLYKPVPGSGHRRPARRPAEASEPAATTAAVASLPGGTAQQRRSGGSSAAL
ncbi:hypothetical protein EMIHUDRAFT_432923, partial [Emiliania huxleyi CCMP1516]|uniref:Association with the SNF1 complex (ASC) domain-containing protein n=2 Tax=Emiliania huxleyi TaxID=2903 RepID=A0A0D3IED7_EMIH1